MKRKILLIGKLSDTCKSALDTAVYNGLISGYDMADKISMDIVDDDTVFMKGYIHTEDFIREIISFQKELSKTQQVEKKLLTHCAVFKNIKNNKLFILSDAACIPFPTPEQRKAIINNAKNLFYKITHSSDDCNVSLLSAGGDTNTNTGPELYDWWMNNKNNFENVNLRLEQLDVALDENVRKFKQVSGSVADIIVCNDINQGNCIWKCLTVLSNDWLCGGILMGGVKPIILNSRGDNIESMLWSMNIISEI